MSESRMRALLGPGGLLAGRFAGFEERPSQIAMAEAIDRVFTDGGRLCVEAGTGTGKTFAYLLPALLHAAMPERRVVISTWTRNLQEQLIEKDLPALRELLGVPLEAALILGRENYVCRRRAELATQQGDLWFESQSSADQLRQVVGWSARTGPGGGEGTLSRLPFTPRPEVWAAVRAERGNCLQQRSPYFKSCVWQAAKRQARDSAVLVVNHALLLADLKLKRAGGSLLPPYTMLIVDEAHHLEEVAADHLGVRVSRGRTLGLLKAAGRAAESAGDDQRDAIERVVPRARTAALELFEAVVGWLGPRRVAETERTTPLPRGLPLLLQELHDRLKEAAGATREPAVEAELASRATALLELAEEIDAACSGSSSDFVAYAEKSESGDEVALCSAPVEPGPLLARELFAPLEAAVLTSATLAVSPAPDRFSWIVRGTGIGSAETMVLDSPFDFRRQARLVIDPLPEPTDPQAWLEALIDRIPWHVQRSYGRAFVLFTSRKTMEQVAEGAEPAIERAGIRLLVQGRALPRGALLAEFKRAQPAVLFGLASFWEGVDVPGRELSHVILTRLPFAVPDHPLEKARARRMKERGVDPFDALSVPQAVLRFKQGFGRLIRRKDDEGIVTVLDARIIQRRYGKVFLDALPDCPKVVLREGEEIPLEGDDGASAW